MDIQLKETLNGGDIEFKGSDFKLVSGYENMPYLAMFGGNPDGDEWWGNALLADGEDRKILSETERTLNTVTLNSAGRLKIEAAILKDLAFIKKNVPGTTIKADVTIVSDNRVDINVWINGEEFTMNWSSVEEPAVSSAGGDTSTYSESEYVEEGYWE